LSIFNTEGGSFKLLTMEEATELRRSRLAAENLEMYLKDTCSTSVRLLDTKEEVDIANSYFNSIIEDKCVCGYCERKGITLTGEQQS
jgi:hypothetical protein